MTNRTLADRLAAERLPLDLALSLAVEVVDAVASTHQRRQAYGALTLADFTLKSDGSVAVTATPNASSDAASDTFAVGAVLYQLFTGLSPQQARVKLSVSPLAAVPPASLLNPALDDGLELLLAKMLAKEPALRPHSLRVVEALLADVCDSLDLDPSRAALAAWAARPAPKTAAKKHVPSVRFIQAVDDDEVLDEDDVGEEAASPLRFDAWAAAACAFTVFAFAMATTL
ncbi:MAG TPA: hypothetical protein VGE37_12405 [Archangium sp.]